MSLRLAVLLTLSSIVGACQSEDATPLGSEKSDQATESCTFDWSCSEQDTVCRPSSRALSEPNYACQAQGQVGDFCGADYECEDQLFCHDSSGRLDALLVVQAGTCIEAGDLGQRCTLDSSCPGQVCRPSNPRIGHPEYHCQAYGSEGETCGADYECTGDLICRHAATALDELLVLEAGSCAAPGDLGAQCNFDSECDAVCRPSRGDRLDAPEYRCQARAQVGGLCGKDSECVTGLSCEGQAYSLGIVILPGRCE